MRAPAISLDQLASLPAVYRAVIPPAYEDRNSHMNMRWYLALYDEAGDAMYQMLGLTADYFAASGAGGFDLEHPDPALMLFEPNASDLGHMSAIASFYVVPAERLSDVVTAATAAPGGWFRPARDTFWNVVRRAGRELETFAWSGWVFNTLDLYLESRHGFMYANFGDVPLSRQLSQARGSDWLVLPAASAVELLAALNGVECPADDVTAFVANEHGPDDAMEEAAAVGAALTTLKAWLAEVSPGSVGLLSVG